MVKATSERLDVVKRAKALVAMKEDKSFTGAAREAGYKSGDSISQLVERFNLHELSALSIAVDRGRKLTYTSEQQAGILVEVQREPDREKDQTAAWSLSLLQKRLRQRKSGTVTIYDLQTPEKKADRASVRAGGSRGDRVVERG